MEQPLVPYGACCLGSINLSKFVKDNDMCWEELSDTIKLAVRFLDNIIDLNNYPLTEIEYICKSTRNIGLGIMGFADLLTILKIPYSSDKAVGVAKSVMSFINKIAHQESVKLGKEKGTFTAKLKKGIKHPQRRNVAVTTIAPTGTISIFADASSGIEPLFALRYERNIMDKKYVEYHPEFKKYLDTLTISQVEEIEKDIISNTYKDPIFEMSHEIDPVQHLKIQAAFQYNVDNAVSKTINLPNSATVEDIANIYLKAYAFNLKGVTVYRDGSRNDQPLSIKKEEPTYNGNGKYKRPAKLEGVTIEKETGCGTLYVTVNRLHNEIVEIFARMGKAGGCAQSQTEALGRLCSLHLRKGKSDTGVKDIVKQLKGISCHMKAGIGPNRILSCSDAIAKVIEDCMGEKLEITATNQGSCPDCGGTITYMEGCGMCNSCGYSQCS